MLETAGNFVLGRVQAYVDLVVQEICATVQITEHPLKSVFFGGGTPSLTFPKQMDQACQAYKFQRSINMRFQAAYTP
jgi:coproporphyrinogen III oxidase-like Fe-S oxidoreductase